MAESKKTILSYIKPNIIPVIIITLIPPFFIGLIILLSLSLPGYIRAKKSIAKLECRGELEKAASELISPNSKKLIKGKVILTEHYVFCKKTGFVFTYDEILWAYKHRMTHTVFIIPVKVTDSLYIAAEGMRPKIVASMGKDKLDEIKQAIVEIYNHNNRCIIGYNKETFAQYKALASK